MSKAKQDAIHTKIDIPKKSSTWEKNISIPQLQPKAFYKNIRVSSNSIIYNMHFNSFKK